MHSAVLTAIAVAGLMIAGGCGPRPRRPGEPPVVTGAVIPPAPLPSEVPKEGAVAGLLCADAAAGGMVVTPVAVAAGGWSVAGEVGLGSAVRQFSIYGWSGRRMGAFSVAGAGAVGKRQVAIGSYAGSPPCTEPRQAGQAPEKVAACTAALGECALAVADLEPGGGPGARPYGELRDPVAHETGGACIAGHHLVIDLDGPGGEGAKGFSLRGLGRAGPPPVELLAMPPAKAARCTPAFAVAKVAVAGATVVDVLGVIDIDRDGRFEVVMGYRHGEASRPDRVVIYSATETTMRLDRVATAHL